VFKHNLIELFVLSISRRFCVLKYLGLVKFGVNEFESKGKWLSFNVNLWIPIAGGWFKLCDMNYFWWSEGI